ncbi:MAG: hypothetical protein WBE16_12555, partial [Candidatus Sulfotelmatobacter sp.]
MSTARVESATPEPAHHHIVRRTIEACRLAKEAAGAAAEGIANVGEHFFQDGGHLGEVAGVFGIDAAGGGLSAISEAEE